MLVTMAPDDGKRLQYSDWLAQGVSGSFLPLPVDKLLTFRKAHFEITGGDPDPPERPSDDQLAALQAWLEEAKGGRRRAPYVDFGIWVPYGREAGRARAFTMQAFNGRGEWQPKKHRGPSTPEEWFSCWAVFRAAMIMLEQATPSELDRYMKGIRTLVERYPSA